MTSVGKVARGADHEPEKLLDVGAPAFAALLPLLPLLPLLVSFPFLFFTFLSDYSLSFLSAPFFVVVVILRLPFLFLLVFLASFPPLSHLLSHRRLPRPPPPASLSHVFPAASTSLSLSYFHFPFIRLQYKPSVMNLCPRNPSPPASSSPMNLALHIRPSHGVRRSFEGLPPPPDANKSTASARRTSTCILRPCLFPSSPRLALLPSLSLNLCLPSPFGSLSSACSAYTCQPRQAF